MSQYLGGITSRGGSLICTHRCYENHEKYEYLAPLGIDGLINPFLIEEKRIHLDGYGFKARKNQFYYLLIMSHNLWGLLTRDINDLI